MASFEFLAIILTGLGLTASIVYYANTLSNSIKTNQKEKLHFNLQKDIHYARAWTNVIFKKATNREEWKKIYNPFTNPELFADMIFIQARFQSLGAMLKDNTIDSDLLHSYYAPISILNTWKHYEQNIISRREELNNPILLGDFEYLYNETIKKNPDIIPITRTNPEQ